MKRSLVSLVIGLVITLGMVLLPYKRTPSAGGIRERSFVVTGALDKEKTFDGIRHEYTLVTTVSIRSEQLFLFNDLQPELSDIFYKAVLNNKGKITDVELGEVRGAFSALLSSRGIAAKDITFDLKRK